MLTSLIVGILATCVYASFAEWFVHRYGMHTERISKWAFRRHAIKHHSENRSLKSFYLPPNQPVDYRPLQSSAVPALWLAHIPVYLLVSVVWNVWAAVGVAIGAGLYTVAYEVLHFYIHTPRNHWFQRSRLFHFYCEYHRIHHHRARWNYNVVCPLADLVLGTLSMAEIPPEPSAPAGVPRHTGPRSVFTRAAAESPPEPVPSREAEPGSREPAP